jgi:Na+-driven multidrug efflux pump
MTTYAGQNIGAGNQKRVSQGAKQGTIIGVATSAAITVIILIFGKYLMGFFTDTEELINAAMTMMRILAVGYVAVSVTQCLSGIMRGAGDTMTPMWISIFQTVFLRVPLAYLFVHLSKTPENPIGDPKCMFYSLVTSWLIGAALTVIFYRKGKWREKAVLKK